MASLTQWTWDRANSGRQWRSGNPGVLQSMGLQRVGHDSGIKNSDSPGGSVVKDPPANAGAAGDTGSIPGSGRSPGGRHGNPFQYPCLENPMDREAWCAIVHRVSKSQTRLQRLCTHTFGLDALWGVPVSLCTSPSPLHGTLKPSKVSMKQSPCWYGNNDNCLRDQERISSSNSFLSSCCELT